MSELEDWQEFQKNNPPIEPKKRKPTKREERAIFFEECQKVARALKADQKRTQCFCRGGLYESEAHSTSGILPVSAMLGFDNNSGIMLDAENGKHYLTYDNSAGEYARGAVEINYCPICGRRL